MIASAQAVIVSETRPGGEPGEQVAAELVGAEGMGEARRLPRQVEVDVVRAVGESSGQTAQKRTRPRSAAAAIDVRPRSRLTAAPARVVEQGDHHVGDQVDDEHDRRQHDRQPHQHREIAHSGGGEERVRRARDAEVLLDEERPRDQQRQHRHGGRQHRDERVAEDVHEHDSAAAEALCLRSADVVLAERLDHRCTDEPGDVADRGQGERRTGRTRASQLSQPSGNQRHSSAG